MVYFQKEEFPEMDDFMKDITNGLGIQFLKYDMSYKDGMQDLVNSHGIKVKRRFENAVGKMTRPAVSRCLIIINWCTFL